MSSKIKKNLDELFLHHVTPLEPLGAKDIRKKFCLNRPTARAAHLSLQCSVEGVLFLLDACVCCMIYG